MSATVAPTVRRRCARCRSVFRRNRGTRLKYCTDACRADAFREANRYRTRAYRERLRAIPVAV